MTEPTDEFTWWEDKQVAVRVNGRVVRGWVRMARRTYASVHRPTVAEQLSGQMVIVLMIESAAEAALFPSEITVGIYDDGRHGRPVGVVRVWPEDRLEGTARTRGTAGRDALARRLIHGSHRATTSPR